MYVLINNVTIETFCDYYIFQIAALSSVGGRDLKSVVKGVLNKIFSVQIQGKITLTGTGVNIEWGFRNGPLEKAIMAGISASFPPATEHEIRQAMANRLRYAVDQKGGLGRALKKAARRDN